MAFFKVEIFDLKADGARWAHKICPESVHGKRTLYAGDDSEEPAGHGDHDSHHRGVCQIARVIPHNWGIVRHPDQYTQKSLMQKSGDIMADLFGEDMRTSETETEIELNFAVLKLKHPIKRKDKGK